MWLDAAFHPFEQLLASSTDNLVALWDLRQQRCTSTYAGHSGAVSVLGFSPDGKLLVSGSRDGEIKVSHLLAIRHNATLILMCLLERLLSYMGNEPVPFPAGMGCECWQAFESFEPSWCNRWTSVPPRGVHAGCRLH